MRVNAREFPPHVMRIEATDMGLQKNMREYFGRNMQVKRKFQGIWIVRLYLDLETEFKGT